MYTEQDLINIANATIKMFDNIQSQVELIKTSYLKQIQDIVEVKRKEAEESEISEATEAHNPISEEEFLKNNKEAD